MQFLLFLPLILLTLILSIRLHGALSFVTLGVAGAAIYNVPAIVGVEYPFYTFVYGEHLLFPTPAKADFVVAVAWIALMVGVIITRPRALNTAPIPSLLVAEERHMTPIALASAVLGVTGLAFFLYTRGLFFLVAERGMQTTDALSILWKWTAPIGITASVLARNRRLVILNALILFAVFLRGDRTLIAISAAAAVAAAAYRDPKWYLMFSPPRVVGLTLAALGVFLGKTIYVSLKSGLSGHGWTSTTAPLSDQLLSQFEPLVTYSQLDYVISVNLHITIAEFLKSVFANALIVPSYFNLSTNLYNETVTATLPPQIAFGVAGNYLAHGWAVGGIVGAAAFYLFLPVMLRTCDSQFRRRAGVLKVFWCCSGATIALYVHRNGLDNLFSFIRQIGIACIAVGVVYLAILLARGAAPQGAAEISPSQPFS